MMANKFVLIMMALKNIPLCFQKWLTLVKPMEVLQQPRPVLLRQLSPAFWINLEVGTSYIHFYNPMYSQLTCDNFKNDREVIRRNSEYL